MPPLLPLVHQIWFSELPEPTQLPANAAALRAAVGAERHRLWTLDAARGFLATHAAPPVLAAFDKLRPFAYKADLARYVIVEQLGGFYLDLSVSDVHLPDVEGWAFVGFRDLNSDATSWKVATNYFFAEAGSAILRDCVAQVLEHCGEQYYGKDPHYPTGPSVLGRSVASVGPELPILIGQYYWLRRRRNKYVLPERRVVGRGKVGGRGLGGVSGVLGGNNYNELWREHLVYGS